MTADNSLSRSLLRPNADALPTAVMPELEEAAGYAWAEKSQTASRHKSIDTLREYIRGAEMFRNHAGNGLL